MKRSNLLILLLLYCRMAAAITLNGVNYTIDTLQQFPAGPGARFYQLRMLRASDGGGRLDCWLMTVDTRNPYVSVEQIMAKDQLVGTERVSAMAERKTTPTHVVYGGVNGDFFATTGDVGRPTGLTIVNNEFAYTPSNNRRLGGVDEQMRAVIGTTMKYSGKLVLPDTTFTIKHVNYQRAADELVLYNQHNGATTGTNQYGTELLVELLPDYSWSTTATLKARVTHKEENVGSMVIPKGKAVLSGHGTMQQALNTIAIGDTLTLKLSLKVDGDAVKMSQCIGGDTYALIVNEGKAEQSNFWNELHPRTAFGASQDNDTLFFLVVDGRGASVGCTTKVLGEIISYYGAYTAVNWDGGGSSCLYVRPFGPMNHGSDGVERAVGNAMYAVANLPAEDNTITAIAPYQPICPVPRYGIVEPKFLGYNQYGVLIDTCVQGVQLSCDPSLGEILSDGRFLASGTESGTLTAVLNGTNGAISCPITVRLMVSAPVAFRLDSLMTDNFHPYQVQIQSLVNGKVMDLLPSALTWQSDDVSVATVDEEGVVRGISDGYADIIGQVGTFADTLHVRVINPTKPTGCWDDFSQPQLWTITSSDGFNPEWENTDVVFDYIGGRAPFVRLERQAPIGLIPDTIRIPVYTEADVKSVAIGIRPNNDIHPQLFSLYENGMPKGEVVNIDIPVAEFFGPDRAIYPLHFDHINFFLSSTTTKSRHKFGMQGIWLLCDGYVSTEDAVNTVADDALRPTKILKETGLLIQQGAVTYSILGVPISTDITR